MKLEIQKIEKRLSKFTDLKSIACFLNLEEKKKLFQLAVEFASESEKFIVNDKSLGVEVAKSVERNYLFALLTANAVKYQIKRGIKKPVIIEMGMGTGINGVSAFLICKEIKFIGVDIDDDCIKFAIEKFISYKMENNVEIIKARYSKVVFAQKADIVINENFGPNLVEEQEIIAANAVISSTHKKTVFVPYGIQIYFLDGKKRKDYDKLYFDKKNVNQIEIKQKFVNGEFRIGYDIIDFLGKIAVSQRDDADFISNLPVMSEPTDIDKGQEVKITLDFNERTMSVE